MSAPRHLVEHVETLEAENRDLHRRWVADQLDVLGVKEDTEAGRLALDQYSPFEERGGTADWSLLRLRTWLAVELDVEVV